ncbi:MAG: O-methyltransferase [Bacteroidota bacterium]|nr:O-methyltransferase [Bacteroidota bacterium]MDP4196677.1 O-methyltransferase [Bacteroidota bacterium]
METIISSEQLTYLDGLRNETDPLILEMEDYAGKHRIPILDWKAAEFLEQLIMAQRPDRVLEIGTAIGYSSIRIARKLRKRGILHTIEVSKDNIPLAKSNIEKAHLEEKIKIIDGDALEIMPGLKKKYDFIFLDADKEDYEKLLEMSLVLLRKRGVIFVDNLLWKGFTAAKTVPKKFQNSTEHIREFNKKFMSHPELKSSILPIGDGIGLGVKVK